MGCALEWSQLIHKNLKSYNILYINGKVKLTDFGSARTHFEIYGQEGTSKAHQLWLSQALFFLQPTFLSIQMQQFEFRDDEWNQIN